MDHIRKQPLRVSLGTAHAGESWISQRGLLTPKGAKFYYVITFSQKLFENEEILAQRGELVSFAP